MCWTVGSQSRGAIRLRAARRGGTAWTRRFSAWEGLRKPIRAGLTAKEHHCQISYWGRGSRYLASESRRLGEIRCTAAWPHLFAKVEAT